MEGSLGLELFAVHVALWEVCFLEEMIWNTKVLCLLSWLSRSCQNHPIRATWKPHCHHCKIHGEIRKLIKVQKDFSQVLILSRSEAEAVSLRTGGSDPRWHLGAGDPYIYGCHWTMGMCPASTPLSCLLLPAILPPVLLHLQASLGGQIVQKHLIVQKAFFGSASTLHPALHQWQGSTADIAPCQSPHFSQVIFNGEGGDFRGLGMEKQQRLVASRQISEGL